MEINWEDTVSGYPKIFQDPPTSSHMHKVADQWKFPDIQIRCPNRKFRRYRHPLDPATL